MKNIFKCTVQSGIIAMVAITSAPVHAAGSGYSEYISSISFDRSQGIHTDVILKNTSANKHIDAVNVQASKSSMNIGFSGTVKCQKDKKVTYFEAKLYLGDVSLFVDTINAPNAVELGAYHPSFQEWAGTKWVGESGNNEDFPILLSKVKNLSANLKIDPIAELNKKLQAHLNQGKSKLSFYQKDQYVEVTRPVTLASSCRKYVSPGFVPRKWGYRTTNVTFVIRYEGDPDISNAGKLNPVISQSQMGGGKYNQTLPLQLNEAKFQPNVPHYIGKCSPTNDPIIRINYNGNGAGQVKFMIEDQGNPVFGQNALNYDSKQQLNKHLDFAYPLKAKLAQNASWKTVNKTFNHPLKIRAQIKDINSDSWGAWKDYGQVVWNHRCTPSVTVPLAGGAKKFQEAPSKPGFSSTIIKKRTPLKPKRLSND